MCELDGDSMLVESLRPAGTASMFWEHFLLLRNILDKNVRNFVAFNNLLSITHLNIYLEIDSIIVRRQNTETQRLVMFWNIIELSNIILIYVHTNKKY